MCTDTNAPRNCIPREGVRNDSNNDDTISSIPPTSGVEVEDDTNSGENNSPCIPTKGEGLSTLDGNNVLPPS